MKTRSINPNNSKLNKKSIEVYIILLLKTKVTYLIEDTTLNSGRNTIEKGESWITSIL